MTSTIPLIADCIYCDPSTVSSITLECNELSMKLRIGKTPSRFREFSLDENADLAGGKSGSSRNSAQIRTGFWGILGVDSLSVEVGRRSTCVIGVSAIDGARAPTCRLVVLECGISSCISGIPTYQVIITPPCTHGIFVSCNSAYYTRMAEAVQVGETCQEHSSV